MVQAEIRPSKPSKPSMLWEHYKLYRPLERVDLPQTIESKVINRYLAVTAVNSALEHIGTFNDDHAKIRKLLEVASAQAALSEDPTTALTDAIALIQKDRVGITGYLWTQAAKIAAFAGNPDKAFELAETASNTRDFGSIEATSFTSTALVLKEKGIDPSRFLDKATEVQERALSYRGNSVMKVMDLTELAGDMAKQGRDPEPWLRKAREILQTNGRNEPWAYSYIANAYASIGNFKEAKVLAEKVKVEEGHHPSRQDTLVSIAYRQFEHGLIEEAIQTAREANSDKALSDLLLKKAYIQAKNGEDHGTTLAEAVETSKSIKPQYSALQHSTEYEIAVTYSRAGRVEAIAGKSPIDMFYRALSIAQSIEDEEHRVEAYKHISIDLFYVGGDVHHIIDKALEIESSRRSPSMLVDILEAALECGYYEYIDVIMKRLESYRHIHKEDFTVLGSPWGKIIDDWKSTFLLLQARIFGERSMTRQEIVQLPAPELQKILLGKHPKAREALRYFGIAA